MVPRLMESQGTVKRSWTINSRIKSENGAFSFARSAMVLQVRARRLGGMAGMGRWIDVEGELTCFGVWLNSRYSGI